MKIAIFYNDDGNLAHGSEIDRAAVESVKECAVAVENACRTLGSRTERIAASDDPEVFARQVKFVGADLVFNLVESLKGETRFESAASQIYELLGQRYTGSPPRAQMIALDKALTRAVLSAHRVPVPPGRRLARGDESIDGCPGPWIVKPSCEDASHGISTASVCRDESAVRERALWVIENYRQPALVESFIDGREFNVAMLGAEPSIETLPLAEIDFEGFPAGLPRLVTYDAKWSESSAEYRGSVPGPPKVVDRVLEARIRTVAVEAFAAIGLRDYGRVDLRVDPVLGPLVIDVNPNPDISPDAGLAKAAARGGMQYSDLIARIVGRAAARR